MNSKILSLNKGRPQSIEWNGESKMTSMLRVPFDGPLKVNLDSVEENTFGNPKNHGIEHSVVYGFGITSALEFTKLLGLKEYSPGITGENITFDQLDEKAISVGDTFQVGEVTLQATYPRFPCDKVNFVMQNASGQKAMFDCGRSGVYFRVLKAGKIFKTDSLALIDSAKVRFSIFDLYNKMVKSIKFTEEEMRLALKNGAFPRKALDHWTQILTK